MNTTRKGLFIGLGGSGVSTVAHIKANLRRFYDTDAEFENANKFLCIDTDKGTLDKINDTPGLRNIINDQTEFIDLGDSNPYQIYQSVEIINDEDRKSAFREWAYQPERWDNTVLSEGAKADRQLGRSALFLRSGAIMNLLDSKIDNLRAIQDNQLDLDIDKAFKDMLAASGGNQNDAKLKEKLRENAKTTASLKVAPLIWVYSSSCGGTGSSMLLDLLYYIDRIYQAKYTRLGEAYLKLFLYMPRPFIDKNINNIRYPLNPFAIFNEINQIFIDHQTSDKKIFEAIKATPILSTYSAIPTKISPFRYIIPIDSMIGVNAVPLENLAELTAKISTYLHVGSAGGTALSMFDNDIRNIFENPTYITNDSNNQIKWQPYLVGAGFRRAVKPNEDLKEYIKARLRYEVLEYGLLGPKFDKVHPDAKQRKETEEFFASRNIYSFINDQNPGSSNITKDYRKIFFDKCGIENDALIIDESYKKDLEIHKNHFLSEVRSEIERLKSEYWDKKESGWSKSEYLEKIMNSVRSNAESEIIHYGLNYTFDLIQRVDNNECTSLFDRCTKERNNFPQDKIQAIEDKVNKFALKPKKYWNEYQGSCLEYVKIILEKQLNEFKIEILFDLIKERTGLLEILRNTSSESKGGLQGFIDRGTILTNAAKNEYDDLAKRFKLTSQDLATDYIPSLASLASSDNSWITNNEFSKLYNSSIVNIDNISTNNATGDPVPLRTGKTNEKDLQKIIEQMWRSVIDANDQFYFCKEGNISNTADQNTVLKSLLNQVDDDLINQLKGTGSALELWFNESLESYLNARPALLKHVEDNMKNHTDIIFDHKPSNTDRERILFVGQSAVFAQKFGFIPNGSDNQHIQDSNSNESFYKIRLVPGFTFQSYSQYEMLSNIYYENKKNGFPEYFPHIHKGLKDASMDDLFNNQFKKLANDKLKDLLFLFYIESLRKALLESNPGFYENIFFNNLLFDTNNDGGLGSLFGNGNKADNGNLNGLSGSDDNSSLSELSNLVGLVTESNLSTFPLSADSGLISIDIQDANKQVDLTIAGMVAFSEGLIEFTSPVQFNFTYVQPSARAIFTGILIKYNNPKMIKNQILDCLSQLNSSNKAVLENFVKSSGDSINKKLMDILTKPLHDKRFLMLQEDLNFIRTLYSNLNGISQQVLYKLKR